MFELDEMRIESVDPIDNFPDCKVNVPLSVIDLLAFTLALIVRLPMELLVELVKGFTDVPLKT